MDDINTTEEMIGGPGIIVEINESKFAKRKHHRGKRCGDGSWIFVALKELTKKIFCCACDEAQC